jgi:hypothetical protein
MSNSLAKPFSTVCTDPFYGQTSGPRPPKFSLADPKLDVEYRLTKKFDKKKFNKKNLKKFYLKKNSMKTRSVAKHSASMNKFKYVIKLSNLGKERHHSLGDVKLPVSVMASNASLHTPAGSLISMTSQVNYL